MSLNGLRRQGQQGVTEGSDWKNKTEKKNICYSSLSKFGGFNKPISYIFLIII